MKLKKGKHYRVTTVSPKDAYYTQRGGIRGIIVTPSSIHCGQWSDGFFHGLFNVVKGNRNCTLPVVSFFEVGLVEV